MSDEVFIFPCSFAQRRLWFLEQMEPGSPAYNISGALRLLGPLNGHALRHAVAGVVRRHESLRTSFAETDGEPVQVVSESASAFVHVTDLSGLAPEAREAEAARLSAEESERGFDLSQAPLLRVRLLKIGASEHLLLLSLHHLVSDGWSLRLLLAELGELYAASSSGLPDTLPDPPLQYADYAAWQHEAMTPEALADSDSYWREKLAGAPPLLELPADRARGARQGWQGASEPVALGAGLSAGLRAVCRSAGATLFMGLLAGFQALLSRYAGVSEVVVGSPVANRGVAGVGGVVGLFANTVALRTDLSGDPSFRELLGRVRGVCLGAYEHESYPFERVVEWAAGGGRELSYAPLVQVLFALQEGVLSAGSWAGGLRLRREPYEGRVAKFDLALSLSEAADEEPTEAGAAGSSQGRAAAVTGWLEYRAELFDAWRVRAMATHLRNLLAAAVADPDRRLSELSLLDEGERRRLVLGWNRTEQEFDRGVCMHELFARQARLTPDSVAAEHEAGQITYAELDRRSNRLARRLRRLGVGPESVVGLYLPRGLGIIEAMLGVLKAGAAYLPLDVNSPAERLRLMVEDARASLILSESGAEEKLKEMGARVVGLKAEAEQVARESAEPFEGGASVHNLAYVIYTSGSTGRPKGVAIEHRSAAAFLHWAKEVFTPDELSGVLASTSVCFDLSIFEIFGPLSWGGKLIIATNALELPTLSAARGVSLLNTVPSAMNELIRMGGLPASVRTVNLAGEPLPKELAQKVYGQTTACRLLNLYGPSEDTTYSTYTVVPRDSDAAPNIGLPVSNTQAYVLDGRGEPSPVGLDGELYLGGEGLARGYLGRPELTAERFVPDPFSPRPGARLYRTGDRCRRLTSGEIDFLGRRDHQVKLRGFRIELGEVESALREHAGVGDVVAVVSAGGQLPGDGRLVAYAAGRGGPPPAAEELRRHLRERLPEYMVPSAFVLLERLPLTPNGKVDRKALPAPVWAAGGVEQGAGEPSRVGARNAAEEVLVGVFEEVLGVGGVGVNDDFFALGGHSLLAARAAARARERLGVEVGVRQLFERPTPAGLAESVLTALREGRELPNVPIRPAGDVGPRPLSYAQQRLWFLDQFEPEGRAAFNLPSPVRLRGALNAAALKQALSEIVRRHEALRTTFPTVGGEPAQSVAPRLTLDVPVFDLCGLDETSKEREATRLTAEEARRSFDLAEGPLLRAALVRLGPEEHRLLLTMHHIISDGWSVSVFARELAALYEAYAAGAPSPLRDLPVQYADYSNWQREWLQGEVLDSQLEYWKRQLAAAPPATELPLDSPRPRARTYRGANTSLTLPEESARPIRELSRAEGGTLYMTLLAAFKVLLSRYTGRADVLVGSPVANRQRSETEDLIGFFVNTLVLRTEVSGELSFRELLGRVRETTLAAFAHQDLPFERLIEEVLPERHLSHTPFFQVFFNMLNLPATSFRLPGLELTVLPPPEASAKFDLTLYVTDEGEGLRLDLVYNADLFGRPRMAELLRQLAHLLGQAVADPSASVAQYSLLTPAAAALLPDPTETLDSTWEGAVHALFRERARETPEKIAVVSHEETWTYRELDARSDRLARELLDAGVRPREAVAIYAHRSAALVWGILGVMKAGAAFVILDSAYPAARLVECMRMANPRGWLRQSAAGPLPQALAEFVGEQPFRCRVELLPRAEDEAEREGEGETEVPSVKVGPDDLAYVAFTSGSTGRPKGILGRHGPLTHFLPWQRAAFGLGAEDRYSMLSGLSHDPLQRDIFTPLSLGATVCVPDPERLAEPGWLAAWAREAEVSIANLTPAMMQLLTQTADADLRLTALRHAFVVGDVLTQREVSRLYELAPSVACVNLYGATETQRAIAYLQVPREADGPDSERPRKRAVPLGRGARDVQLLVLNAAGGMAGVGELGELYVRSPHLAAGYLGGEELTRERFLTNPFTGAREDRTYKTGDLGRYLPDGNVEFAGRNDFQVKLRGFRIELGEIESALERHPAVHKAVVMAGDDGAGDKLLAAYLVARERPGPGPGELRRFLQDRLPTYMVPAVFITLDELPVTPNGKVDRRALPAPSEVMREAATGGPVAPRTHVEEVLANIWAGLLNVPQAGADDNFFELGGHSLLATQAVGRIREAFGVGVSLRALFERPTPAGLARHVEAALRKRGGLTYEPLKRAERGGELPLSYAQQRLWFLNQLEPDSSAYNMTGGVRLSGPLRLDALEQALGEVRRRHEALRARFVAVDGRPVQFISRPAPLRLPVVDLSGLPPEAREGKVKALFEAEAHRPFDLSAGPLLRATLLRLGAREHAVLFSVHHIVSDGWSLGVLTGEVGALYAAFGEGRPSPLAELPVQYVDYAAWQRETLRGEVLDAHAAYWKRQLAEPLPAVKLGADRERPAAPTFGGETLTAVLPEALRDSLKALSLQESVTLFVTLMAAFKALLRYYGRQDDVVVGTDVANRTRVEAEGLIGFFVNQLVLRTDLSGNPTFRELLAREHEVVLDAHTYQDLPFDRLVGILNPERELHRTPLFQVKLVLQNTPAATLELPGLVAAPLRPERRHAKFDLLLNLWDTEGGLVAALEYNTGLFDAQTAARLLRHYELLLRQAASQPAARLDELYAALEEAERERQSRRARELEEANVRRLRQVARKPFAATTERRNLP